MHSRSVKPWPVLAAWAAVVAVCVLVIWRTPFTADLTAFLPAKPDPRQEVLIEQLHTGVAARTLLIGIEGGEPTARAEASRRLAAALRATQRFEQVQNGEFGAGDGSSGFAQLGAWLFEHRYQLSPAVEPRRFTAEGLHDAIGETLSLLGTPGGNQIKPLLERDPTGETQRIAEALIPAQAPRTEDGVWVSRDGTRAVLLATVKAAGADLDGQQAALDAVRGGFAPLASDGKLTLRMSGAPLFSVESRAQIEAESKRLAIAGTLLMSVLLWLAFASLPALFIAMLPVLTGVLVGIAAVGLGFGRVHGLTLGFGTTLIGEAVDYAIYYLIQARRPAGDTGAERGWQRWLRGSWPTVRLGLFTSIAGFLALAFSGFEGLAQLGVFSTAGLVGAALATRFVLPVLAPDGTQGRGLRGVLGRAAGWLVAVLPRWRWPALALGAAAAVLLVANAQRLWSTDLASLSPLKPEALALDASLRADLTASEGGVLLVVQASELEATLQRTEALALRLDGLLNEGRLAGYNAVTRWLPSAQMQRQRLQSLPDGQTLTAALQAATAGGPLKAERLAPFVAEVQAARTRPPVTLASVKGTAAAPLVDALLIQRPGGAGWAALVPVQFGPDAPASLDAFFAPVLQGLTGVQVIDIKPELDRLYARYLGEAQGQTLLGALAVVLLIALWLRNARRLVAVCQPLALSVLLTMALLVLAGVQLSILHLVGLLLVVAVGSNYALFFDMLRHGGMATEDAAEHEDTLASLALANVTTVLSFGLIALSGIPALSAIGVVVAPGALLALLLAAACAPAAAAPRPKAHGGV
jgi:predicted exporter